VIIRVEKRTTPYVVIDKTALEDPRLSFRAKGIHAYLLSRPDNWAPNRDQLAKVSREGRDAVVAALSELETFGYFKRERKAVHGRFVWFGTVYEVSQVPLPDNPSVVSVTGTQAMVPLPDFPAAVFPSTENPVVISNEVTSTEEQTLPSSPPARAKQPPGTMKRLTEGFASRQGFRPDRWEPIQQGYRLMLDAGYSPEQIEACEDRLVALGWTWTINTVRDWVPRFVAGVMPEPGARSAPKSALLSGVFAMEDDDLQRYEARVKGGVTAPKEGAVAGGYGG